jgi:hypothetical protein
VIILSRAVFTVSESLSVCDTVTDASLTIDDDDDITRRLL